MQTASTVTSLNIPNFSPRAVPACRPWALLPVAELHTCQDVRKDVLQGREAEENPRRWWQPRAAAADPREAPGRACPRRQQRNGALLPAASPSAPSLRSLLECQEQED